MGKKNEPFTHRIRYPKPHEKKKKKKRKDKDGSNAGNAAKAAALPLKPSGIYLVAHRAVRFPA